MEEEASGSPRGWALASEGLQRPRDLARGEEREGLSKTGEWVLEGKGAKKQQGRKTEGGLGKSIEGQAIKRDFPDARCKGMRARKVSSSDALDGLAADGARAGLLGPLGQAM